MTLMQTTANITSRTKPISFEFFPPKTEEGVQKLRITRQQLACFKPDYYSVTYGAGGSTQDGTLKTALEIKQEGIQAAPHLSCIGSSREKIRAIADEYKSHGIRHIVALRGDMPSGVGDVGEFPHASDLVSFLREEYGEWFHIEVGAHPECHPQAPSPAIDTRHFVNKVKAGADAAITQYFFNADAYFRFVDEVSAHGVTIPIVPGIMPIRNFNQLACFSDMCGAEIPRWLRLRLQSYGDDLASLKSFGLDVITEMSERLLTQGAPGLHFYTLNSADAVSTICQRLAYDGIE